MEKYNVSECSTINNYNYNSNIYKSSVKSLNPSKTLTFKRTIIKLDKNIRKDPGLITLRNKLRNLNPAAISDSNRINSKFRPRLYMSPI